MIVVETIFQNSFIFILNHTVFASVFKSHVTLCNRLADSICYVCPIYNKLCSHLQRGMFFCMAILSITLLRGQFWSGENNKCHHSSIKQGHESGGQVFTEGCHFQVLGCVRQLLRYAIKVA